MFAHGTLPPFTNTRFGTPQLPVERFAPPVQDGMLQIKRHAEACLFISDKRFV